MITPKSMAAEIRAESNKITITQALAEVEEKLESTVKNDERIRIKLPTGNTTTYDFAKSIASNMPKDFGVYYSRADGRIVEYTSFEDKILKRSINGLKDVSPARLLNKLETFFSFFVVDGEGNEINKSPSEQSIKLLMKNDDFLSSLLVLDRLLTFPMPYELDGKYLLPTSKYDGNINALYSSDCPKLERMDVEEAKQEIYKILSGFCFKSDDDRMMAFAFLITPMARGLFSRISARTPLFFLSANRERSGKDYLAGVRGIIYEGQAVDQPPISDGEHK